MDAGRDGWIRKRFEPAGSIRVSAARTENNMKWLMGVLRKLKAKKMALETLRGANQIAEKY